MTRQESRLLVKVVLALLYNRTSKERRKGNLPMPTTRSVYTVRLPPSIHSPCSDVPSEPHPMIVHTINITPDQFNHAISSDVATPQLFPYDNKLYRHHLAAFLRITQRLRPSVTRFLPYPHEIPIPTPKYFRIFFKP